MGATKTEFYTAAQNEIALIAKALGHPARIAIIEYLLKVDTCICGDIVNELPLAQPTISQHLKELKTAVSLKAISKEPPFAIVSMRKYLHILLLTFQQQPILFNKKMLLIIYNFKTHIMTIKQLQDFYKRHKTFKLNYPMEILSHPIFISQK